MPGDFCATDSRSCGCEGAGTAGVATELASEVAALSRGCAGWASRMLETASSTRRGDRAGVAAQWIGSDLYGRLVTAFRLGEQFTKRRSEVIGMVQAAIQILREEMIAATQPETQRKVPKSIDHSTTFDLGVSALSFSRAIAASLRCLSDLESNVRPRLALEAMVLAWPSSEFRRN